MEGSQKLSTFELSIKAVLCLAIPKIWQNLAKLGGDTCNL